MFISRRSIFALSVMMDIAQNAKDRLVSAKELADRHDVMPRFFEIMLKNLANAGLIRGQRGPRGGYQLARESQSITISEIVSAVNVDRDEDDDSQFAPAHSLSNYLKQTNEFIARKLSETTLSDLMSGQNAAKYSKALAS